MSNDNVMKTKLSNADLDNAVGGADKNNETYLTDSQKSALRAVLDTEVLSPNDKDYTTVAVIKTALSNPYKTVSYIKDKIKDINNSALKRKLLECLG